MMVQAAPASGGDRMNMYAAMKEILTVASMEKRKNHVRSFAISEVSEFRRDVNVPVVVWSKKLTSMWRILEKREVRTVLTTFNWQRPNR